MKWLRTVALAALVIIAIFGGIQIRHYYTAIHLARYSAEHRLGMAESLIRQYVLSGQDIDVLKEAGHRLDTAEAILFPFWSNPKMKEIHDLVGPHTYKVRSYLLDLDNKLTPELTIEDLHHTAASLNGIRQLLVP